MSLLTSRNYNICNFQGYVKPKLNSGDLPFFIGVIAWQTNFLLYFMLDVFNMQAID